MSRTVVSANGLEDLRRAGREIIVPRDALLTPAARDWIREHAYPVHWIDGPPSGRNAGLGVAGNLSQSPLRSLRVELERIAGSLELFESNPRQDSPAGGDRASQLAAVRRLCGAVQRGTPKKGVVLIEDGAVIACVANKFRGVRACVGHGVPAFDQAVRELGINVLVIEYPSRTFHEMRQMVRRLVSSDGRPSEVVREALAAAEASQA